MGPLARSAVYLIGAGLATSNIQNDTFCNTIYRYKQRQAALRARFETLHDDGRLSTGRVTRWPRSVTTPVTGDDAAAAAVDTYETLAAAVDAVGGRLDPFFRRRPRTPGLLVGTRDGEVVTFPICGLIVRRDGEITGVYPCWTANTHHRLEAGLAALESGDPENLRAARTPP